MKFRARFPNFEAEFVTDEPLDFLEDIYVIDVRSDAITPLALEVPERTILVGQDIPQNQVFNYFSNSGARHFVQLSRPDHYKELFIAAKMIHNPMDFANTHKPFPGANGNFSSRNFHFRKLADKTDVLAKVETYLQGQKKLRRFEYQVLLVVDELISNALFNAPFLNNTYPYHDSPRSEHVAYPPDREAAEIYLYHDNDHLFISCTDPWGSLNQAELIHKLSQLYTSWPTQVKPKVGPGGAGLGCHMIIDCSLGLHFITHKNKKTKVCACFTLGRAHKNLKSSAKNFHFCEID